MYNDNDIDMLNLLKISIDLSKKENKKLILTKEDAYYSLTNKLRVVKKYADKDRKLQYEEKKNIWKHFYVMHSYLILILTVMMMYLKLRLII